MLYFLDDEANDLVTCLAELGSVPIDRMMGLLQPEVSADEHTALAMLQGRLIKLVGLIRHEPALPILVEKMRAVHDWLNSESREAMIRLGTDDVIHAVEKLFLEVGWDQSYGSLVLRHIHSDETIRVAASLLQCDSLDEYIRQKIALGLACQFSTEGLEAIGKYLDTRADWSYDMELTETVQAMQATAKLLQVDLPHIDNWQARISEALESDSATTFGDQWLGGEG